MSFPRYPRYKDSGVEWLGEVPEHWELARTKRLFELMKRAPVEEDGIVTAFRDGEVTLRSNRRSEGFTNAVHEHGYQRVLVGDLVIHAMDAFAGAIGVSDSVGKSTPVYAVCRARTPLVDTRYYARLLRHMALSGYIMSLAKGVRERSTEFRWSEAADLVLAVPPPLEQTEIAVFLDREAAKIDALIAEQRRLVELLKEQRQALISHAVTKGLDPDATMKSSGVEWIGDVPAHWSVQRVKSVSSFTTSGPRGWSGHVCDEGPLFIQSGDLNDNLGIDFAGAKRVQVEDSAETTRTQLASGDIVVCITGAKTGNVAVCRAVPEKAYINQHLCLVRPTGDVHPVFLGNLLKSSVGHMHFALSQYGLKQGLSLEDVREAPVVRPPLREQSLLLEYIHSQSTVFDTLTSEAERAIVLLRERRTALISAAVTGKIDVRGLAAD